MCNKSIVSNVQGRFRRQDLSKNRGYLSGDINLSTVFNIDNEADCN